MLVCLQQYCQHVTHNNTEPVEKYVKPRCIYMSNKMGVVKHRCDFVALKLSWTGP